MMSEPDLPRRKGRRSLWAQALLALFIVSALGALWYTNKALTERYTETVRNRAEVRLTLYAGNVISELQRTSIVPQLLARDPELIAALSNSDYSLSSQRLLSYVDEIGAASIMLFDRDGRMVAATVRERLGANQRSAPYFIAATRSNATVFTAVRGESGAASFIYSRRVESGGSLIGVIAVEADLSKWERSWAGTQDAVILMDSEGKILLASEPRWRGLGEAEALARQSVPSAIERALRVTQDWSVLPPDAYLRGEAVLRRETRVPFQGWRMVSYTAYT